MLSPKNKYFPNGCTDEALDEVFSDLLKRLHHKIDVQVMIFKLRYKSIYVEQQSLFSFFENDRNIALSHLLMGAQKFGKTAMTLPVNTTQQVEHVMKKKLYEIQYSALGDTVWIHCSTGDTVGRFSVKFGMDIHTTVQEQMAGKSQCLRCTHGQPTHADFKEFCDKAKELWGVEIDQEQMDTSKLL
jgi:hypothetical protein